MELREILLNNILSLIHKYGIKECHFLTECNIHNKFLSNLRSGALKHPSFEDVCAIAKFFNVSIDSLACYETAVKWADANKNKIEKRDIKIIGDAYSKLDAKGQVAVCRQIITEKERIKNAKKFGLDKNE